ncbi:MAG: tRNA threonylcarbamoyladenosine dehydratase [Caldimonas sp.]
MNVAAALAESPEAPLDADLERRFGGLRRLYGDAAYQRIRAAGVAIVGVGGVGSWAAEALARSGVAALTLIDLDHVAESNVNRQVQALGSTLGMAKVDALARRVADIHPGCHVTQVEEFVDAGNWPGLMSGRAADVVIDACDDVRAKTVLAAWALETGASLVVVGAAGGKRHAERVEVGDLATATHDPILAALRQRLRKLHGAPRLGDIGLRCVFSREAVVRPGGAANDVDGSLNCSGYGSSVAVTASFGMVAATLALESAALAGARSPRSATL